MGKATACRYQSVDANTCNLYTVGMESSTLSASVKDLPLHTITQEYGTDGLAARFQYEVSNRFNETDQRQLQLGYLVMRALHGDQARSNEPYENHLLRVATRMMVHYDINDVDTITAALLHDSLEDQAARIAGTHALEPEAVAYRALQQWFNPSVATIVKGVSNPVFNMSLDKHTQYRTHVEDHIVQASDVRIFLVKLSDFTDNAVGLHYATGPKVPKLASKYLPLIDIFERGLDRADLPLSTSVIAHIKTQLGATKARLLAAQAGDN